MHRFTIALDGSPGLRAAAAGFAILLSAPGAAWAASNHHHSGSTRAAAPAAVSYGGVTPQDFPVVLEINRQGRRIVRATIAIRLTCTSGATPAVPDSYTNLPVSRSGRFSTSFGPQPQRNDDGTMTDFEGTLSGAFNSSRTRASGTWTFKATDRDAAGAVTNTCDSGAVRWRVKQ